MAPIYGDLRGALGVLLHRIHPFAVRLDELDEALVSLRFRDVTFDALFATYRLIFPGPEPT